MPAAGPRVPVFLERFISKQLAIRKTTLDQRAVLDGQVFFCEVVLHFWASRSVGKTGHSSFCHCHDDGREVRGGERFCFLDGGLLFFWWLVR